MLVILDTNVLLSALRTDSCTPAKILDAWRAGRFRLVTSIEQARKFDFVVNLKAAKALGLSMPKAMLLRADRVIE